jgi:hypothetical protein
MFNNDCSGNACSRYLDGKSIRACIARLPDDWNGLCAYQNGRTVTAAEVAAGMVEVRCGGCSCAMSAGQYAGWNGLCAYQREVRQ